MTKHIEPLVYMAGPYTHDDPLVQDERLDLLNRVTYAYLSRGQLVYCAMRHNSLYNDMGHQGDWSHWSHHNHQMLARCDEMHILTLAGWQSSKGLKAEIEYAESQGIKIQYLSLDNIQNMIVDTPNSGQYSFAIQRMSRLTQKMINDRHWQPFNSPKNVVMSLMVEAAELAEHFTWVSEADSYQLDSQTKQAVTDEIADVFINILNVSHVLKIDLLKATEQKLKKIEARYPVPEADKA